MTPDATGSSAAFPSAVSIPDAVRCIPKRAYAAELAMTKVSHGRGDML
jgi:hypothetical protein